MPGPTQSFKCPDCGAAVQFDGASAPTAVRCAHCGNTVAVPEALRPRIQRIAIDPALIPKGPVARPSLLGCLLPLVLAVGVISFTGWRMSTMSFAPFGRVAPLQGVLRASTATRTRILQPGQLSGSAAGDRLFVVVRNYEPSRYSDALARFDLGSGARAWEQPATYQSSFAVDGTRVYVTNRSRLRALDEARGTPLWEATLSDEVPATCETCLAAFGGRVVAHTKDDVLQVFDGATGRSVMSRTLGRPNRVAIVGSRLLVIAREARGTAVLATVFDGDGRELHTFPVRCAGEWGNNGALGWNDFTHADETTNTLVAWYRGGCVQRYDLAAGTLLSSASTDATTSLDSDASVLAVDGMLYLAEDETLHALAPGARRPTQVAKVPDYSLRPIGASKDVIAVRARRRIGSTRFEVWGVDARSGARLWQLKMADGARPMEPPDEFVGLFDPERDDSAFAAHVDGDALRVVRAGGAGRPWVSVETLDLATGASKGEKRMTVDAADHWSAPKPLGWRGRTLWLLVDGHATAIDVDAGRVLTRLP